MKLLLLFIISHFHLLRTLECWFEFYHCYVYMLLFLYCTFTSLYLFTALFTNYCLQFFSNEPFYKLIQFLQFNA